MNTLDIYGNEGSTRTTLTETSWRTNLGSTPEKVQEAIDFTNPDALVMTSKGIRVEFDSLIGESVERIIIPEITILGTRILN
jgi:hypothetical protein